MAMKAVLFVLAFALLVTMRVSSVEEPEHYQGHGPEKAPIHPPMKASAPCPTTVPSHPPMKAPIYPPTYHGCSGKRCVDYCIPKAKKSQFRECQRMCSACCKVLKCVPDHPATLCPGWGKINGPRGELTCP